MRGVGACSTKGLHSRNKSVDGVPRGMRGYELMSKMVISSHTGNVVTVMQFVLLITNPAGF